MNQRKNISKSLRFSVFSRDSFTCRYCGRQSDVIPLHVDHVIPVCQGGTNDIENLLTACEDCNLGKGGKTPTHTAPTEEDRLRLAQERNEQIASAKAVAAAAKAREDLRQEVVNYWCAQTGRDDVDSRTISTVCHYIAQFGADVVFRWIDRAAVKCGRSDTRMGQYISGIRRAHLAEMEDHNA